VTAQDAKLVARHFSTRSTDRSSHRKLKEEAAGQHYADGEKALRDSCDDLEFVHDRFSEMKLIPHACRLRRAAHANKLNT
jgi:hypothetical protein